jgi:hypothetical protein
MKQSASKTTDTREETTIPNPEEDLKVYLRKAGLADGKIAAEFSKAASTISGLYYLHGDHLGTATYVTDSNGETTQFFLNLPFGETMAEQNLPGTYENPYKFNAKELDVLKCLLDNNGQASKFLSGYNMKSAEERKKYDENAMCKAYGKRMMFMSIPFIAGMIIDIWHIGIGCLIAWVIWFVMFILLLMDRHKREG